jgi:hypothetical protein
LTHKKKKDPHDSSLTLTTLYEEYEQLDDDDEDEEKKKRFKKILHALLKYHTLHAVLNTPDLYRNATYGTALKAKDGSYDGQPRRVSVVNDFFHFYINFFAKVEWVSVSAANGACFTSFYLYALPSDCS